MLLAGKTLNTTHMLTVTDFPYKSNKSGNVESRKASPGDAVDSTRTRMS
jgi:hypothetical protein